MNGWLAVALHLARAGMATAHSSRSMILRAYTRQRWRISPVERRLHAEPFDKLRTALVEARLAVFDMLRARFRGLHSGLCGSQERAAVRCWRGSGSRWSLPWSRYRYGPAGRVGPLS